jgi:phosphoglycerate dehydrogenase-like enzyme
VYPFTERQAMLAEADVVAVAAPLVKETAGMLGSADFQAMKRGVLYINVSRGPIAQESALIEALRTGQVAAAGLDVFAVEPLPQDHPFWTLPNVLVSPHYSGETVNRSAQPGELFLRNLCSYLNGELVGKRVDLTLGY